MTQNDSIRICIELFEGPLDLLLHLIQRDQIDIASISIAQITSQYLDALDVMKEMDLDIAGDYLVMAATLILMKSKTLLPPDPDSGEDEILTDQKSALIERLKEYQLYREAGHHLQELHAMRSQMLSHPLSEEQKTIYIDWIIDAQLIDLLNALKTVFERIGKDNAHLIQPNSISIRETMSRLLTILNDRGPVFLHDLFNECSIRQEAIVLFLAMLELIRVRVIQARQRKLFGQILLALMPDSTAQQTKLPL